MNTRRTVNAPVSSRHSHGKKRLFGIALVTAVTAGCGGGSSSDAVVDEGLQEVQQVGTSAAAPAKGQAGLYLTRGADGGWRMRLQADGTPVRYTGRVVSSAPFTGVTPFSMEANDVLDTGEPRRIAFEFNAEKKWQDGADFYVAADAQTCFTVDEPGVPNVYVGDSRTPMPASFSLTTLGACDAAVKGQPAYDPAAEAAMFLWQEDDGTWRLRGTAGGGTASYAGSITAEQPFAAVTPFSFESSDVLDTANGRRVAFQMNVDQKWQDGIDFTLPSGANGCFDVSATNGVTVRVGANRTLVPATFDMKTLGPCDTTVPNSTPVADAGPDQQVATRTLVTLDGGASNDADGDALTYAWTMTGKPAGSGAALSGASTARPAFTPDVDGRYTFSLTVSDGQASSTADAVVIDAVTPNVAPVANAGPDRTVDTRVAVTLDGGGSSDANGDTLVYAWTLVGKPAGSVAALSGAATVRPTFTPDKEGQYAVSLVVSDGKATSAADTVAITAVNPNTAPVANAGADQLVVTRNLVTLDGSGSGDADGDTLTYAWTLVGKPAGSTATLAGATMVRPAFTPDVDGQYTASLVVYDGKAASAADSVTVTAANTKPVANAGPDRSVDTGSPVTLDGSGSSDADGDTLTYAWTLSAKPAGSLATLSGTKSVAPAFTPDVDGQYTVSLVVSDGKLSSTADTVLITAVNSKPVANAGADRAVDVGTSVTLDGSSSSDANGDSLAYRWSLSSQPAGSAVIVSGVNTAKPSFTPNVAGNYVLQLVVNDGKVDSAADSVTVTANAVTVPPADEPPATGPVKTGYAPLRVAFTDTFGNGATANSDIHNKFWSVGTGSGITVQESGGNLVIASQAASGDSGMVASAPSHRFNFFTQPLRFTFSGLALGGTTPNAYERVAQFSLNSARQASYAAADSLQLRLTGGRRLTLKWKTDATQSNPATTLIDTTLAQLPTAIVLTVDQTSYRVEAGGSVFSGQHDIPLESWGMRGDSALVIEGLRSRDALDGTKATVTLADVKVDSLPLAEFFRNGSVADNGHRPAFWTPLGSVTESGGSLQLTASSSSAPSAAVVGPVSKEYNFFARKLRFSGEVAFDAASAGDGANTTRFGLASTQETTWNAPDALGLLFSANKRVQLGIKANSRNKAPETATVLLDRTLTFQPTSFDLALDRTQYELNLYGSGGSVRYTGAHNMKFHDWGVAADVAVTLEAQRSASGTGKVNWTTVAAVDESAYYVAPTVFGPVGDGITLEKPELGDEQPLADLGLVDVTKAPFSADPTGQRDSTEALRHAMDFAREHYMAAFLPPGSYTVSDTLECAESLYYRTSTTTKLLNDEEGPCILMGSRAGSSRPKIVLAPRSAGFTDSAVRKPVVHLWARSYQGNPENAQPNISYNQIVRDLDIVIGEGNSGAVGIHHQAAQGSAVQDVTIDATHGFSGLDAGIGSGGLTGNVKVIGGRYGLYLRSTQPVPTMVGMTLVGQTVSAINYGGRQTLTLVGAKIVVPGIGPAIKVEGRSTQLGQVALIDSEITFDKADSRNVAVNTDSAVYLKDVYVRNAGTVVTAIDGGNLAGNATGWRYVKEYAHGVRPPLYSKNGKSWQYEVPVYLDGVRKTTDLVVLGSNGTTPPADLQSRHLWDDTFPHWQQAGVANVKKAPYYAKGDGVADDTDAIQAAVNASDFVFLPKGYYRVTRTIQLRPNSKLFGLAPNMSILLGADGSAFSNASAPQPVLRTANDAAARTVVGFLGVFAPVDLDGVFGVHWRAGRNSIFRSVNVYRNSAFGFAGRPGKPAPHTSTHPLVRVSDNGGGRWFLYHQGTSFSMAPSYRHFMVDGTREPLRIYQLNPEHAKTDAGTEIRNAANVDIYGFKAESNYIGLWVRDSDYVSVYGYGGNGAAFPYYDTYPSNFAQYTPSLFRIERTPNIRIAQLPDEPRVSGGDPVFGMGVDPNLWHMLLEKPVGGGTILTDTLDRPVLYKRGNPNGSISFGGSTSEGTSEGGSTATACGAPAYNGSTDAAVLVWKACQSGVWSVRAVAGGGSATYTGSVSGSQSLTSVTPVSIESHDTLDYTTDPRRITFGLTLWSPSEDGFDFGYPSGTDICVNVAAPAGTAVLVGPGRTPVTGPFSPETLAPCTP